MDADHFRNRADQMHLHGLYVQPLGRAFEQDVRAYKRGRKVKVDGSQYANVIDGWMGIAFIDACVASSKNEGAWTKLP